MMDKEPALFVERVFSPNQKNVFTIRNVRSFKTYANARGCQQLFIGVPKAS
jgi:hypothetical protein